MPRNYGWKPDVPDFRDFKLSASREDASLLPKTADLRALMPPVWDQGQLGSCTGHAIGAAIEFEQRKVHPKWDFMPSRLFIYYNERNIEGTINSDAGAMIRTGIKTINTIGVCREDLWTYDETKFTVKPPKAAYDNAVKHHALQYQRVPQTVDAMKRVIAGGNPFVFGFSVYESFESDTVASSGIVPMPLTTEKLIGGHAVCACGYDDNYLLVRNSWSSGWGIGGYFKFPWDYAVNSNLTDDLWVISSMQ